MDGVEEEFALQGMTQPRGLASGFVHAEEEIGLEGRTRAVDWVGGIGGDGVFPEVEGEDVGGAGDAGVADVARGHLGITDKAEMDVAGDGEWLNAP